MGPTARGPTQTTASQPSWLNRRAAAEEDDQQEKKAVAEVRRRILRSSLIQSRSILLSFLPSVGRGKHRGVDAHPQKGRSARSEQNEAGTDTTWM